MARTLAQLADTTTDMLISGFYNQLIKIDEFTAALISRAELTDKPNVKFNRKVANPTASYFDCSTSYTFGNISGSPVTVALQNIGVPFSTCIIGQNLYSSFSSVLQNETEGAMDGLGLKIAAEAAGSGNGSTAIYGLGSVVAASQTISAGGSFSTDDLDVLIDTCKVKTDAVMVGHPATVRAVVSKLKAESALDFGVLSGTTLRTPMYQGYNVLRNENVANDGSLYMVDLNQGYKLFMGESGGNIGGIWQLDDLGLSQSKPEHLFHLYCHIAGVSLNQLAISKLNGVA
jgi:hypothetical protein